MIWDKCDAAAYMAVLLFETVEANQNIIIEWVETHAQSSLTKWNEMQPLLSGSALLVSVEDTKLRRPVATGSLLYLDDLMLIQFYFEFTLIFKWAFYFNNSMRNYIYNLILSGTFFLYYSV